MIWEIGVEVRSRELVAGSVDRCADEIINVRGMRSTYTPSSKPNTGHPTRGGKACVAPQCATHGRPFWKQMTSIAA